MSNSIKLIESYQVNSNEMKTKIRKKLLKKTCKIPLDFFISDKRPKLVTSFKNLYTDPMKIIKSKAGLELGLKPNDIIINEETMDILETLIFNSAKQAEAIEIISKYLGSGVIAAHEDFVIFLHQSEQTPSVSVAATTSTSTTSTTGAGISSNTSGATTSTDNTGTPADTAPVEKAKVDLRIYMAK